MSTITPQRSPHVVRQQEKKELQVLNTKLEQYGALPREITPLSPISMIAWP
jgi:hypothetical protein